jgi:hypothetical protein
MQSRSCGVSFVWLVASRRPLTQQFKFLVLKTWFRLVSAHPEYIMQAGSSAKIPLEKSLRPAAKCITISFDDWTANNGLRFLDALLHDVVLVTALIVSLPPPLLGIGLPSARLCAGASCLPPLAIHSPLASPRPLSA